MMFTLTAQKRPSIAAASATYITDGIRPGNANFAPRPYLAADFARLNIKKNITPFARMSADLSDAPHTGKENSTLSQDLVESAFTAAMPTRAYWMLTTSTHRSKTNQHTAITQHPFGLFYGRAKSPTSNCFAPIVIELRRTETRGKRENFCARLSDFFIEKPKPIKQEAML